MIRTSLQKVTEFYEERLVDANKKFNQLVQQVLALGLVTSYEPEKVREHTMVSELHRILPDEPLPVGAVETEIEVA